MFFIYCMSCLATDLFYLNRPSACDTLNDKCPRTGVEICGNQLDSMEQQPQPSTSSQCSAETMLQSSQQPISSICSLFDTSSVLNKKQVDVMPRIQLSKTRPLALGQYSGLKRNQHWALKKRSLTAHDSCEITMSVTGVVVSTTSQPLDAPLKSTSKSTCLLKSTC